MDHFDHQLRMGLPLTHWITDPDEFNVVIRFEELQKGFLQVCADLNLPQKKLKKTNKSKKRTSTRDYFTPRLQEIVIEQYGTDFENFGYSTELP